MSEFDCVRRLYAWTLSHVYLGSLTRPSLILRNSTYWVAFTARFFSKVNTIASALVASNWCPLGPRSYFYSHVQLALQVSSCQRCCPSHRCPYWTGRKSWSSLLLGTFLGSTSQWRSPCLPVEAGGRRLGTWLRMRRSFRAVRCLVLCRAAWPSWLGARCGRLLWTLSISYLSSSADY